MFRLVAILVVASVVSGSDEFLANWMGRIAPVIANQTLLDLSLPGTHDSMTWDLSTTVSDDANDLPPDLAWVLHEFHNVLDIGNFVRTQSKTQGLNMTEQLDNGVRFVDFRITYTAPPDKSSTAPHDWYCLHFMESNNKAMAYLKEARAWIDAHPTELLVLWFSRHGGPCTTVYPKVANEVKQAFWSSIETLFDGVLLDTRVSQTNVTTYSDMMKRNHRVVAYVSDYTNFTASSPMAIDGCQIDNQLGNDVTNETKTQEMLHQRFLATDATKTADKLQNRFLLQSLAGGAPSGQIKYAAELTYQPFDHKKLREKCAAILNIPGTSDWCPMNLQDIGQLANYYSQSALDAVLNDTAHMGFPNAFYLDAFAPGGLIRTGTELFATQDDPHATTGYCYVDSLALYNVRHACASLPPSFATQCAQLDAQLQQRRAQNPLARWNDPEHGRLADWPAS